MSSQESGKGYQFSRQEARYKGYVRSLSVAYEGSTGKYHSPRSRL